MGNTQSGNHKISAQDRYALFSLLLFLRISSLVLFQLIVYYHHHHHLILPPSLPESISSPSTKLPFCSAILDMKIQRDRLHQYQKKITILTNRETEIARECLLRQDKPRALLALRRKKYQESLLSKTDAQLEQLEQLTSSVEFALVQKDVVFGLQQGTSVLKEIHREMGGLEAVEKLLGESEEERAYQRVCFSALLAGL